MRTNRAARVIASLEWLDEYLKILEEKENRRGGKKS
jgi:hypothetical protein